MGITSERTRGPMTFYERSPIEGGSSQNRWSLSAARMQLATGQRKTLSYLFRLHAHAVILRPLSGILLCPVIQMNPFRAACNAASPDVHGQATNGRCAKGARVCHHRAEVNKLEISGIRQVQLDPLVVCFFNRLVPSADSWLRSIY